MGRSKTNRNIEHRRKNIPTIKAFCEDLGLQYEYIHGHEWHIRVQGIMDIFPTSNKYHLLKTGDRGQFDDYEHLGRIFEEYVNKEELTW